MDKDKNPTGKICQHYKNNTCQFGMNGNGCKFDHPKRCKNLMNYVTKTGKGCNLGKNCPNFHPKMCPMSISKAECFDTSCTLCHVKGTKRKRPPAKEIQKLDGSVNKTHASHQRPPTEETKEESEKLSTQNQSFLEQISLLKKEIQEALEVKISSMLNGAAQNQQKQESIPQWQLPQQPFATPVPRMIIPQWQPQQSQHQQMSHPLAMQYPSMWYQPNNYYQAPIPQVPTNMY